MTDILRARTVARSQTLDPATDWDAVYRAELPRVYGFVHHIVGDVHLAEDLTAATFERAWRKRGRYRDDGKITAWLFTIARNTVHDHFRSRRPQNPPAIEAAAAAGSPDEAAARNETAVQVRTMLAGLPEKQRTLVALKYGAGLSNREIARATGMSESNVGTTLQRTLATLRARWERDR